MLKFAIFVGNNFMSYLFIKYVSRLRKHSRTQPDFLRNIGRMKTGPSLGHSSDLSITPWYEFWRVEILQFLKHLYISCLIGKFPAISKRSKFPHFEIFSENYLTGEMYLRVSFITPNNIFRKIYVINGRIFGNTEGHFKGALPP